MKRREFLTLRGGVAVYEWPRQSAGAQDVRLRSGDDLSYARLAAAKEFGLTIPMTLLARADEVIE